MRRIGTKAVAFTLAVGMGVAIFARLTRRAASKASSDKELRRRREDRLIVLVKNRVADVASSPELIDVCIDRGILILRGPAPADEIPRLLQAALTVPGVEQVASRLLPLHEEKAVVGAPAPMPGEQTSSLGTLRAFAEEEREMPLALVRNDSR